MARHHSLSDGEVRAQLGAILTSEVFRRAGGQAWLLRYPVEHKLAGEPDAFKEYALGVEVRT